MKRKASLYSVLIIVTTLLISCTKPASDSSTAVTVQSSMSAKIDGTSWVGTSFSGTNVSGTLVLEGGKADGSQFTLDIPSSTSNGSHAAGGSNNCQVVYQTGTTYSSMTTGTITINSNSNKVISGSFSGSFTNQSTQAVSTISNGAFTMTYQ